MSRHRLAEHFLKWPEANVWEWLYLDWAYVQLKRVILLDLVIVNDSRWPDFTQEVQHFVSFCKDC